MSFPFAKIRRRKNMQGNKTKPTSMPALDFPLIQSSFLWEEMSNNCEVPNDAFKACVLETGEQGYVVVKVKIEGQVVTGYTTASTCGEGYSPIANREYYIGGLVIYVDDSNIFFSIWRRRYHQIPKYFLESLRERAERRYIGEGCLFGPGTQMARTRASDFLSSGNSEGEKWIGKIHRSYGCLYVSYGGKEYVFSQYEVLCRKVYPADLAFICRWNIIKYFQDHHLDKNAISKLPLPENLKLYLHHSKHTSV
uniref:Uncharacterized protein LOC104265812 n=1 Tax=Phallusia mammillata TaxID=59560 RepID=A0A6F9DJG9_9ASCI|nr:uncharacterized protein LOC104265812 [Phallusia mammillata]